MADETRCKHRGCECTLSPERVAMNQPYCSDFCAETDNLPRTKKGDCGCGHATCSAQHALGSQPPA